MITWKCKKFADLDSEEVYKILQLRNAVFVVEQNCVYQDCDDKDQFCHHLVAWKDGLAVAYSRLIPPGVAFENASIGRVVTSPSIRGSKVGRDLFSRSLTLIIELFGVHLITIGAQLYLKHFYQSFGFIAEETTYMEDGIEHIHMHFIK